MEFDVEKGLEELGGIFEARGLSSNAGEVSVASVVENARELSKNGQ